MCDNGADVENLKANGRTPLLYSAINGFHDICMYLCLRVKDVDIEDEQTGQTVFETFLINEDIEHMNYVLSRGSNINHINFRTNLTPLHLAIEKQMRPSTIKFLLKNKANPHIEDTDGKDCCDKAKEAGLMYSRIRKLNDGKCSHDPSIRIKNKELLKKIANQRIQTTKSVTLSAAVNTVLNKLQAEADEKPDEEGKNDGNPTEATDQEDLTQR